MKKTSVALTLFTLVLLLFYQTLSSSSLKHRYDRLQSEQQFYKDAATQVCLNREAVIYAANAQGFYYVEFGEVMEQQFNSPVPNGTVISVDVHIKPDPFLAPATGAVFHFGQDGCWINGE
ncbi:MAG: hypothetical protein ABJH45_22585 [Paracoccaceae bacterium]